MDATAITVAPKTMSPVFSQLTRISRYGTLEDARGNDPFCETRSHPFCRTFCIRSQCVDRRVPTAYAASYLLFVRQI